MIVVDSSGWIEYFTDGPKADAYSVYLEEPKNIITPAVVVYEVYKKIKWERGDVLAKLCLGQIQKTRVAPIDEAMSLLAADLSLEFSLPMADSFVLATARSFGAELITSDNDFREVPGVHLV